MDEPQSHTRLQQQHPCIRAAQILRSRLGLENGVLAVSTLFFPRQELSLRIGDHILPNLYWRWFGLLLDERASIAIRMLRLVDGSKALQG